MSAARPPERPPERHVTLDATRGVAVMGILLINIVSFAMPSDAYVNPVAWGGWDMADRTVWMINQLLFEGRMRGLFALLFGASAMLVMARADAAGRSPVRTHLSRMAALLPFGLAHFALVWDGDILVSYALLGCVIWIGRDWSARRLAVTGAIAIGVNALLWAAIFGAALALQAAATAPGADATLVAEWRTAMAEMPGGQAAGIARDLATYRGDYTGILAWRLGEHAWFPIKLLFVMGGETLGYMLIGMALMKSGFFTGGWPRSVLIRRMWLWYALSLPVIALMTWWAFASGFDPIVLMGNFIGWSLPFRALSTLGHAALIVLLVDRFANSAIVARIAAAGRMAFSNYLLTSLMMTTIFYGYGLALYGHVGRAEVNLFVFAMWAAMLLWSTPWLDRFAYGPFEWAWRSLARLEMQPWRRNALASQSHLA